MAQVELARRLDGGGRSSNAISVEGNASSPRLIQTHLVKGKSAKDESFKLLMSSVKESSFRISKVMRCS